MISSLAWVPAGVAASHPKKYEMSRAEQELVQMMQEKGNLDEAFEQEVAKQTKAKKIQLPVMENSLPADLRMDEYSSDDEDDDEQRKGVALGQMLVGASESDLLDDEEEEPNDDDDDDEDEAEQQQYGQKSKKFGHADSKDEDDDSDDDLNDVPDTREFEDVDVEGLQAMGLSHVGMNGGNMMLDEEEDDESEAEDVRISADDALVAVAKTEDVSVLLLLMLCSTQ